MTRTDIHRPSAPEFDPQAYQLRGVFDLMRGEASAYQRNQANARIAAVKRAQDEGYVFASHQSNGQCGHCGAHIRYAALLVREDVHEMIYVGETCLDNRFLDLTKAEFDALRLNAKLDREKQRLLEGFKAACEQYPSLVEATYAGNMEIALERQFGFDYLCEAGINFHLNVTQDIASKARRYGSISERQANLLEKLLGEIESKLNAYATKLAAKAELPALDVNNLRVEGVVLKVWEEANAFGPGDVTKMTVKLADGNIVRGTMPTSLVNAGVEKGFEVTFQVSSIKVSNKDEHAGWYSRPRNAIVLNNTKAA